MALPPWNWIKPLFRLNFALVCAGIIVALGLAGGWWLTGPRYPADLGYKFHGRNHCNRGPLPAHCRGGDGKRTGAWLQS